MKKMKNQFITLIIAICIGGCNSSATNDTNTEFGRSTKLAIVDIIGEYATPEYFEKNTHYDWVAVLVSKASDSSIQVRVRSRVDIKKPTCTDDFVANQVNDSTYKYNISEDSSAIILTFNTKQVSITSEGNDSYVLQRPCSGGGSLMGKYLKSDKPIDRKNLDPTNFYKTINWVSGITCFIETKVKDTIETLYITITNPKEKTLQIAQTIHGHVVNAEAEDLDGDGYPEVLVYITTSTNSKELTVLGFSPNKGKSLSMIAFPSRDVAPKDYAEFVDNNEFAIVENRLIQRFPMYKKIGNKLQYVHKTRQLQYKLVDGESSKKFVMYRAIFFNE